MLARRHTMQALLAAACLFVLGIAIHSFAQNQLGAQELLNRGTALVEEGRLQRARVTLQRIDPVELSADQRQRLQEALRRTRGPSPDPAQAEADQVEGAEPSQPRAEPAPAPESRLQHGSERLLQRGSAQLQAGQTERARATLQQVDPAQLNAQQRERLRSALRQTRQERPADEPALAQQPQAGEQPQEIPPDAAQPEQPDPAPQTSQVQQSPPPTAPGMAEQQPPTPQVGDAGDAAEQERILRRGLTQLEQGNVEQARITLQQVDPVELNRSQQQQFQAAMRQIRERQAPAAVAGEGEPQQPETMSPMRRSRILRAQELVARADAAAAQGEYNRAAQLYEQAVAIDPGNQEAQAGLETARAQTQMAQGTEQGLLTQYQATAELRRQQAIARYAANMSSAREAIRAGNYAAALDNASLARSILETNRQYLSTSGYEQRRERVAALLAQIEEEATEENVRQLALRERRATQEQVMRRIRAERAQDQKIQGLLMRARDLSRELSYVQALDVLEQILFLEPNNIAAQAMKVMIQDAIIYRNYDELQGRKSRALAEQMVETAEAAVPYTELIQYPPDWPQITARRAGAAGGEGAAATQENQEVHQQLQQVVPLDFTDNRLENAIEYLRQVSGVNIYVNWGALEGAGIDQGTPVSLQLENVTVGQALELILNQVGGALIPVGYNINDGVVTVSTMQDLAQDTTIVTYDIRDLLVQAPTFDSAPEFDLSSVGEGGQGGGGGGNLFDEDEQDDQFEVTREQLTLRIMQLLRDTVDPSSWRINGGLVGSMSELNGSLIVNTTSDNHRALVDLLSQLRETRAIQINVEARFLLVDRNFLEEVGVDMDIQIEDPGGNFGPITISQDSATIAARQNSALGSVFLDAGGGQGGQDGEDGEGDGADPLFGAGRALSIGGSFLNDIQVDFLIRATQNSRRSTSLSAPRVTFFNGQRAYVLIATQQTYISDLTAVTGTGVAAFDPEVDVVSSGVKLDVEGTVSADRRYVTMTVRPSLSRLVNLRQIEQSTTVDQVDLGGDQDQGEQPDRIVTGLFEAPEIQITEVKTTVSVPDQGTLLIGGQRLYADVEIESGVPILSKLPLINRLFTNRSITKDERTLLILIKPTILIQTEKENQLFPGLQQGPEMFGGVAP